MAKNLIKIAGYENLVEELYKVKEFLYNAKEYAELGVRIPHGILLYGVPGVGKTVMAKSLISEDINLIELRSGNCCDEDGIKYIEATFEQAKNSQPCILFIDELDKIAGSHESHFFESDDKALKTLLQELDRIEKDSQVLIIATCNELGGISRALIRSGRFDRVFNVPLPKDDDRRKIIDMYVSALKIKVNVDVEKMIQLTDRFSGAEIECLINESALYTLTQNREELDMEAILTCLERMEFKGLEDKSVQPNREVALHEAGHAVAALCLRPETVVSVTVNPQGTSKGHLSRRRNARMDKNLSSSVLEDIAIALGGRAAEMLELGSSSTGCSADLVLASNASQDLVTSGYYGFEYAIPESMEYAPPEEQRKMIWQKTTEVLNTQHERVTKIIQDNKDLLYKIIDKLMEKRSISGDELRAMINQ